MNLDDPEERDLLAGEYVLGTLEPDVRRQVEAALADRPDLAARVAYWEERLADLAHEVQPVEPSTTLWQRIRRDTADQTPGMAAVLEGLRRRLRAWQLATGAATAAAAALAVYVGLGTPGWPGAESQVYVAVLQPADSSPAWLIEARGGGMVVHARDRQLPGDRDFELWAIPEPNAAPVSLGVLERAERTRLRLPADLREAAGKRLTLAVSTEPRGGSPTGAPTGPVVFSGILQPVDPAEF